MTMLILPYTIHEVIPNVYTKFNKILDTVVPEKSLTKKKIVGEKEKRTNKGMISMRMLVLSYTINP